MRQTKVISVSLPIKEAKRLTYLARVARRAKSDVIREALASYELSSLTYFPKDPTAWKRLEELGRELSRGVKRNAFTKALQEGRE